MVDVFDFFCVNNLARPNGFECVFLLRLADLCMCAVSQWSLAGRGVFVKLSSRCFRALL